MSTRLHHTPRIGIYAGTFDPIHKGHIAFALQSLQDARLDHVVFIPEQKPRGKDGATHIGHRVAMLERALRPYPRLSIRELPDKHFSIPRSVTRLSNMYPSAQLFRLIGSDVVETMPYWPNLEVMFQKMGLVIGLRDDADPALIAEQLADLPARPHEVHVVATQHPIVSSTIVRLSLSRHRSHLALPRLIEQYVRENWLYVGAPETKLLLK